jgi:GNAT superfamily N-acetyltransferase
MQPKFIANNFETVKGTMSDFHRLKEYHYVIGNPVCIRGIWKVQAKEPYTNKFPNPLAVIVYAVPINEWAARNVATNSFFSQFSSKSERQSQINSRINYIARIIVDPRFHRCGIASQLLKDTLPLQNRSLIETMTPIEHSAGLFKKFGFECYYQPTPEKYVWMQNQFYRYGIPKALWDQPLVVQTRIDSLSAYKHAELHRAMRQFVSIFHHHEGAPPSFERTKFILSKIRYPNNYWLYRNPEMPLFRENVHPEIQGGISQAGKVA